MSDEELRNVALTLSGRNSTDTLFHWLKKVRDETEKRKGEEIAALRKRLKEWEDYWNAEKIHQDIKELRRAAQEATKP